MRTIISLEQVTKDSEMKWVVTKGNENLSIKPLSFLGNMRRLMWVVDRGLEFQMIRMGLDRVWNVNVLTIGSWIKGKVSERNLPATSIAFLLCLPQMSNSHNDAGATVFGPSIRGNPPQAIYQRSSWKITHTITTNPPHMLVDLTMLYLSPEQVRLRT